MKLIPVTDPLPSVEVEVEVELEVEVVLVVSIAPLVLPVAGSEATGTAGPHATRPARSPVQPVWRDFT
jgi:hypothetical protein